MVNTVLLVLVTIFIPPLGVFLVTGCGVDLVINILLTVLGYFPGHIHAFYIEYQYIKRRDQVRAGDYNAQQQPVPGVYSERVRRGGVKKGEVVVAAPQQQQQQQPVVAQQGYPVVVN